MGDDRGHPAPMGGIQGVQPHRALDLFFQVEEPFLHDEFEGGHFTKMDRAHGVHNAIVDDVEAVKRCVAPQIDGGNDEALVPGFLTYKTAEERLARTVVAAQAPDPGSAILAEFQVSAEAFQFLLTADSDAIQAAGRDETALQSTNEVFADELFRIHLRTPASAG